MVEEVRTEQEKEGVRRRGRGEEEGGGEGDWEERERGRVGYTEKKEEVKTKEDKGEEANDTRRGERQSDIASMKEMNLISNLNCRIVPKYWNLPCVFFRRDLWENLQVRIPRFRCCYPRKSNKTNVFLQYRKIQNCAKHGHQNSVAMVSLLMPDVFTVFYRVFFFFTVFLNKDDDDDQIPRTAMCFRDVSEKIKCLMAFNWLK